MQPTSRTQLRAEVNWSIRGQLIDQFRTAVVVVNGPPYRGPLITRRSHRPALAAALPTAARTPRAAVLGYAATKREECITRLKRHGLTTAKPRVSSVGGDNVLHQ